MDEPSHLYRLMHFLHLTAAALWLGGAVAADAHMRRVGKSADGADQHDALRAARRRTIGIEMPAVTALVVAGLVMIVLHAHLFTEVWFHLKLTAVIALIVLFVTTTLRQRQIADRLDPDAGTNVRGDVRLYLTLRTVSALVALVLILAVTYRFGAGGGGGTP